ncbi:MAG TPA: M23 family metallopeptidase [Bacteroidales bacterium]|nr:M23 family metallopeptidase [Bacteroidales bacterium]
MKFLKTKYKFNPESLQYEKIRFSFRKFLVRLVPYIISSAIFGFALMFLYIVVFESPEEKILRAENEFLKENFQKMNARLEQSDKILDDIAKRDNYIYRTTFQQDTIAFTLRDAGVGGSDRYKHYDGYESTDIVKDVAKKLDQIENKLNIQSLSYNELIKELKKKEKIFKSLPVLQPIHVNELTRIGSFYGYRPHPILGVVHMHHGIDMVAPTGTPVYAAGDGTIEEIENNNTNSGYGNSILIDHGVNGLSTRYAHLSKIHVKKGQKVVRGQLIGEVGSTGLSTAPHLHYEIMIYGSTVNPLRYMITPTADEYEQLLKLAQYPGVSFD